MSRRAIGVGMVVQYSDAFLQSIGAVTDADLCDGKAIVREVRRKPGRPDILRVQWDTGEYASVLVTNVQIWTGDIPVQTRREWGMISDGQDGLSEGA